MFRLARDRRATGGRMVREADAAAFVVAAAQALAVNGYAPKITSANSVRLVQLGELMLAEFGIGGSGDGSAEESDEAVV